MFLLILFSYLHYSGILPSIGGMFLYTLKHQIIIYIKLIVAVEVSLELVNIIKLK